MKKFVKIVRYLSRRVNASRGGFLSRPELSVKMKWKTAALVLAAAAVFNFTGCNGSVELKWSRFTPMVVDQNQSSNIIMEAKVSGAPDSVKLALTGGTTVQLYDNGLNGDNTAGDGVYTVPLTPSQILNNFTPDDVNRNFVGYLSLYKNGTEQKKYNIFADILTSAVPPVNSTSVSADMQYSENLVNIVDPGFYSTFDATAVTQKFYSHFGDLYDFINIIYEFPHYENAYHFATRNDVQGTGIGVLNNTGTYGSSGRLLGMTMFPVPTIFDGASDHYQHELGHQWVNFLHVAPLDPSIPHWPLSDLASGIMGWGTGPGTQGLHFDFDLVPSGSDYQMVANNDPKMYTDLSLYLMGLLPPTQVQTHVVFNDQTQSTYPATTLHGPVTTVSVNDIITALGARSPDSDHSQRRFHVATIIVSKDGLLSADAMRLYDWFSVRATGTQVVPYSSGFVKGQTKPFHLSTQGNAWLSTGIERRILVDSSRDGGTWWFPQASGFHSNTTHQGKPLADYLRSLGYTVEELPRPFLISSQLLSKYDIVIRANVFGSYTQAELNAYQQYLDDWGNVLLLADHSPQDALSSSLGLVFAGETRGENKLSAFNPHVITQGVGPLPYVAGSSLTSYPAQAHILGRLSAGTYTDLNGNEIKDSNEPTAAPALGIMRVGKGHLVFCGDTNLWEAVPQPLVNNVLKWFELSSVL